MNQRDKLIEDLILEVLSFYEPMSLELILLDMPKERIAEIENFNREDLEKTLKLLKKKKRIKKTSKRSEKEDFWIKIFPKKGVLHRFLSYVGL